MRIAAPISSVTELEMLLECGADELYCGVNTPEWEASYGGAWWMNRRSPQGANLSSWEDLQEVAAGAHAAGATVHVTLNAPFYTAAGMNHVLGLAERLTGESGVDGLIVSDVNLLLRLAEENPAAGLHLSSLGACTNSRAAAFYASLGVKRIILPRQLRIPEIERIVTARETGGTEFEIFAVNDGCYFEEGLCQTSHTLGSPFCLTDWDVRAHRSGSGAGRETLSAMEIDRRRKALREYLWYQNNCGSSIEESGVPNGPCSLCWFAYFRDWGIASVKIVGREASFYRKMRSLQLVKAVMDEVRNGASRAETARFARSVRGTPAYCDKGYMCYFGRPGESRHSERAWRGKRPG